MSRDSLMREAIEKGISSETIESMLEIYDSIKLKEVEAVNLEKQFKENLASINNKIYSIQKYCKHGIVDHYYSPYDSIIVCKICGAEL